MKIPVSYALFNNWLLLSLSEVCLLCMLFLKSLFICHSHLIKKESVNFVLDDDAHVCKAVLYLRNLVFSSVWIDLLKGFSCGPLGLLKDEHYAMQKTMSQNVRKRK